MEEFYLIEYIAKRLQGKRHEGPVQDLLDDMRCVYHHLQGKTAQEIVDYICLRAVPEARKALIQFVHSYRHYCKTHNLKAEEIGSHYL